MSTNDSQTQGSLMNICNVFFTHRDYGLMTTFFDRSMPAILTEKTNAPRKPGEIFCWSVMLLMMLMTLTGCAAAEEEERWGVHRYKRIHWQEQVRLSTGEEIVIERGEKLRSAYGGVGTPGWVFDEAWLEAKLPAVGKTRWEGALSPLVLDVTPAGEWYLLGIVRASRGEKDYRLSDERKRYVAFKLRGTAWKRIPFVEFPEMFKPNLLASTDRLLKVDGAKNGMVVDSEMKQRLDSRPTLGEVYKQIDRSLGE